MFKKTKRKIVVAILFSLIFLLFGTILVIYLASYAKVTQDNRRLLDQYAESYTLLGGAKPDTSGKEHPNDSPYRPPRLELSTFYSVALSDSGEVLKIDNADISSLDESALIELAAGIFESGSSNGVQRNLIYRSEKKDGYTLVAFLDNTVTMESAGTLISYTLIFGSAALVILFFFSVFIAGRIVRPLEESYKKQKQFISDAGHELKTPVAVVNANIELLSREFPNNQWLQNIQYENERMSALISQLLDLAHAESACAPMQPLDLGRLVYGEALPFETVAYESGLRLSFDIAQDIVVCGNGVQLKQLVSILLDNAISHGTDGTQVIISLREEKGSAVLSVLNSSQEIPPELRELLFERFYRLDEARSGETGHYGLGLAIAKAITQSHKGTIGVSCEGNRVEFTVRLPIHSKKERKEKD